MFVKSVDLKNFRNYRELSLEFDPGVNILYGDNAQGKTNILEAVYLSGTTRSHRGSKDKDMILMGEDESHIRMITDIRGNLYRTDVHIRRGKGKGYALNGVPVKKASELYGIADLVFFSPEDLGIIKHGPSARRKFLDLLLCGVDRIYFSELAKYARILDQRNALLKKINFGGGREDELDVWDAALIEYGEKIIARREAFIEELRDEAAKHHLTLTDGAERLKISYEPASARAAFADNIARGRKYDIKSGTTNTGPHRDDMAVLANGMDLRIYGSQGQQRTAALSMKLAEIDTIFKAKGQMPVLLLDDVLSELDGRRSEALLRAVRMTQTLITCTGLDEFVKNKFHADRTFLVKDGTAKENHII